MSTSRTLLTTPLRIACGLGLCAAALLVGGTRAAATAAAPQLSIAVESGPHSAAAGDTLPYSITIRNLGGVALKSLSINQSMPTGLRFKSADLGGKAQPLSIEWRVNLKAGATATVHSTMTVTNTPPDLLRLGTVACARTTPKAAPIVCASFLTQLPAGAAADRDPVRQTDRRTFKLLSATGAGGLAVIGLAAVVVTRHRRRRTDPTVDPSPKR